MQTTGFLQTIEQDHDARSSRFVWLMRQKGADLGRLPRIAQLAELGELNTIAGAEFGHGFSRRSVVG